VQPDPLNPDQVPGLVLGFEIVQYLHTPHLETRIRITRTAHETVRTDPAAGLGLDLGALTAGVGTAGRGQGTGHQGARGEAG
jgi:hypothetical protein